MNKLDKEELHKIHQNFTLLDAHFDLLYDVEIQRSLGRKKVIETDHLPNFLAGGFNIIVSSIFLDSKDLPEMALRKALDQVSALYQEIDESAGKIMLCKDYHDIQQAIAEKKVGIVLSFEGVEPLYDDINLLRVFYELGVRGVGLTWSRRNYAADGCTFSSENRGRQGGLTEFGREVVKLAYELGMFIDVSHLNDEGFWDVMDMVNKPVIASHSNCRAIAGIMRNLNDDQLKALAAKGGVVGLNAASMLAANDKEDANIAKLVEHIDHMREIMGLEHIALGFDFCDNLFKYSSEEDLRKMPYVPFDVVKGHARVGDLTEALLKKGYSREDIKLIYGENYLRAFRATVG